MDEEYLKQLELAKWYYNFLSALDSSEKKNEVLTSISLGSDIEDDLLRLKATYCPDHVSGVL